SGSSGTSGLGTSPTKPTRPSGATTRGATGATGRGRGPTRGPPRARPERGRPPPARAPPPPRGAPPPPAARRPAAARPRRRGAGRRADGDRAASALLALERDRAAVLLDDRLDPGQPDAGSGDRSDVVAPAEPVEHQRLARRRYAEPLVAHPQHGLTAGGAAV